MVGIFLLLVPIALAFNHGDGHVVRADGLPGAVVGGEAIRPAATTATARPARPPTSRAASVAPASTTTSTTVEEHNSWTASSSATSWSQKTTWTTTSTWHSPSPTTSTRKWNTATTATTPRKRSSTSTTTTISAPARTYTRAEVEAIIRSVWPAELADEAVRIAKRESNLRAGAHNWCCYGIFQIYFAMNRPVLASIGVTEAVQLFDPLVNATAAYAIYLRSGWAPWK
jgi:hypothetical protein